MRAHWRQLNFQKVGALHAACRQGIPNWHLQKVINFRRCERCAVLLKKAEQPNHSYASGNAGGIFGPSPFLGATLGGAIGTLAHSLCRGYTAIPGAYSQLEGVVTLPDVLDAYGIDRIGSR